ncbi:MAG: hypothetical protein EKK62_03950 [Acidimicrobiia bacterium]|nr:MAG: hypothetical protein EKK62_03950 [Acidimicrobiia bacterium]
MATSFGLPDGSILSFGTTLGASKTMSAISNASEAVATLEPSHGVVENDILIVTSGWLKLNKRIVRADSVSTNDVTFEDINTSSTTVYPAGSGTGSIQEVTAWTQIPYIKDFAGQGGEQQTVVEEFLDSDDQYEFFTSRTPRRYNMGVAFQGSTATHFPLLRAASDAKTETAFRIVFPGGSTTYFLAVPSFDVVPTLNKGQVQVNNLVLLVRAEPTIYG